MGFGSDRRRSRTAILAATLTLGIVAAVLMPSAHADPGSSIVTASPTTTAVPTTTTTVPPATTSVPTTEPAASTTTTVAPPPVPLGSHLLVGAYTPDLPDGRGDLPALESSLGSHLAIAAAYVDWSYVIGGPNELWMADNGTRIPLLAWEPSGVRFTDVTSGAEDSYLQQVATSMLAFPYTVYVRPWPEMNANWSTWQPTADGSKPDGGTPAQFVAAWRYLVDFFRSRGVTNLKFVFDPDSSTYSDNTPISLIWPGASYVDVLGIDGYNWGNDSAGDTWQTFDQIFTPMYDILTSLDPGVAVWVCETGSKEPQEEDDSLYPSESAPVDPNDSKGTWITQMLDSTAFPEMQAVVWFDKKKERDWPIESSTDSLTAFQAYFADSANAARQWQTPPTTGQTPPTTAQTPPTSTTTPPTSAPTPPTTAPTPATTGQSAPPSTGGYTGETASDGGLILFNPTPGVGAEP